MGREKRGSASGAHPPRRTVNVKSGQASAGRIITYQRTGPPAILPFSISPPTRYVKHRDALPYRAGRKLTAILYLNEGWEREHGGELRLWPEGGSRCAAGVGALSSGEGAMKGGGASSSRQGAMSRRDGAMNSGKGVAEPLKPLVVAPLADRLIIFISSLQHEVLPSWADRCACGEGGIR
jgi:hypothetical protein